MNDESTTGRQLRFARPAGMTCPACEHRIVVDPFTLLEARPVVCDHCGLALHLDVKESEQTLQALRTYMDEISELEKRLPGGEGGQEIPGTRSSDASPDTRSPNTRRNSRAHRPRQRTPGAREKGTRTARRRRR